MFIVLFYFHLTWAQATSVNSSTKTAEETPYKIQKLLLKVKKSPLGQIEFICKQREALPQQEVLFSYVIRKNKKKTNHYIFKTKTYNGCKNYKLKLSNNLKLSFLSPPGERIDEPGALMTVNYDWQKSTGEFREGSHNTFSPFLYLQSKYRKRLTALDLTEAEKLIIQNRSIVEAYSQIKSEETELICKDFYKAYLSSAENLFKQKKYQQSFDLFLTMRQKFGDPQNIFFDAKTKNNSVAVVCQMENSNTDQSENHFYTFARKHLNAPEFVPYMIALAEKNLNLNTNHSKNLGLQILKYVTYLLKSAPHSFQLKFQKKIISLWSSQIDNNSENPNYSRLINEDNHLIFLLVEAHGCQGIPLQVINRISQKNDDKTVLKAMTLTSANDQYSQGLEKSAIFEYTQFVQSRVLLKICQDIPKVVLERYFKFVQSQPYGNE